MGFKTEVLKKSRKTNRQLFINLINERKASKKEEVRSKLNLRVRGGMQACATYDCHGDLIQIIYGFVWKRYHC